MKILGLFCVCLLSLHVFAIGGDLQPEQSSPQAWKSMCQRCGELSTAIDRESFGELLMLLKEPHQDVSYAASLALAKRRQFQYTDLLLRACSSVRSKEKWHIYKMLGSYADKRVLVFLAEALGEEFRNFDPESGFDDRNRWYINRSIDTILATLVLRAEF